MRNHWLWLLGAVLLGGCADRMTWDEDVQLHDGSFITVKRAAERGPTGFPYQRRGALRWQSLDYPAADVHWRSDEVESLASFDIVDGIPYLITFKAVNREAFCVGKAAGTPIANFYRLAGGTQSAVRPEQVPMDRMRNNLSGMSHWAYSGDNPTHITWQRVLQLTNQEATGAQPIRELLKLEWLSCPRPNT